MKPYIQKTMLFLSALGLCIFVLLSAANHDTDNFYYKFATPKQQSLILGTSRAAQGLHPEVFNGMLDCNVFNYAFTVKHSPYGPVYLKSVMRKLAPESNGERYFILSVDPWSISSSSADPNNTRSFRENDGEVAAMRFVNGTPNIPYLLNHFDGLKYEILFPRERKTRLDSLGLLTVTIDMSSDAVNRRSKEKTSFYRERMLPYFQASTVRQYSLEKLVSLLRTKGRVYLVRLPVSEEILSIENELMADFTERIGNAIEISNGYLDLSSMSHDFEFTDGNHLEQNSGRIVSNIIAEWILDKQQVDTSI